ncbi:hypothetical protein TREPR_2501 [Treponema primitia ZAS-2]|uniref:DUF4340 domain-containing protein n=1 Tax=Treponema primitia (strain ATCC BAA-887 / DSM 12427 / ZAS-2) TaxID=545694 RepID=F5YH04_TREPZ|nr:DUF4340 domain-containing protein [Treponema primitia]AEF85899.1 hypothetical protein TREPR_2501 [Treponema primitia ZAS-2]
MLYKKKVLLLTTLVGFLALVYALTLFFDPERVNSRNAAFLWLDPKFRDQADSIELSRPGDWANPQRLARRGNDWFALLGDEEFPAKSSRVDDLLRALSVRAAYPVRGSAPASHGPMGVAENSAARILVKGGAGLPLLDLLIGGRDASGMEVYLRKNGQNEVRSGQDTLSTYINGVGSSWYNLRIFPTIDQSLVQRLTLIPLPSDETGEQGPSLVITRNGGGWSIAGLEDGTVDTQKVESYIRGVLEAEGENFVPNLKAASASLNEGRITLELGNRSTLTLSVGSLPDAGEEKRRAAAASGSSYVYTLADWTVTRLFRDSAYFVKQE